MISIDNDVTLIKYFSQYQRLPLVFAMYQPGTHRRIALLICDVPADPVREQHGDYTRIFGTLLGESLKPINETHSAGSLYIYL